MNGQFLRLSSIILFVFIVTITTATTTTTFCTSISTPTPVLTCPDCRDPHQNCGAGNGHQDSKHCIVTKKCTLTATDREKPCCSAPGAPGWNGKASEELEFKGVGGNTAQDCCNACIADLEWFFGGSECFHASTTDVSACNNAMVSGLVAGIIRCPGGPRCIGLA
ncbi:6490_t:CDS:2 [Paraglomus occultum]|uniref:6490_t:CDS:1 n=1 Tax=Paraglomus occultum TaxID=144539 RepID=A0A9N8Z0T1_9GLOM|nr:6490_t:CDS:2 [Paraglomus occultum]